MNGNEDIEEVRACTADKEKRCPSWHCIRRRVYFSPQWFWGWVDGNPELKDKCEYYLTERN